MVTNHSDRWKMYGNGAIIWDVQADSRLPHQDHLEMSGRKVSVIVHYGVDAEGQLTLSRQVVWPGLRTIPNDTHASLMQDFGSEQMPLIHIDGKPLHSEKVKQVIFDGTLHISSVTGQGLDMDRTIFPSTVNPCLIEKITLYNATPQPVEIQVTSQNTPSSVKGVAGIYLFDILHDAQELLYLQPGDSFTYFVIVRAYPIQKQEQLGDFAEEETKRKALVHLIDQSLRLETPDPILNTMFGFAKLRAAESIFQTKGGLMHSPGGGHYYAAIWTNDQVEYAGPFFPYLGYDLGNEATLNALRLYMPFMGPDFHPIPSSIIAEGVDIWEGAGDRGDAAMYAYGASLFVLTLGDRAVAEELWPAIEWCLAYCEQKLTRHGVIASDSDELEGRFPSGSANLSTSCLAYSGYLNAALVASSLGKTEASQAYIQKAKLLKDAIVQFFGANVEGYETYRYYEENDILRSWICLPLTVGIMERRDGTIQALMSDRLWTDDGMLTQAGDSTFWDRSTLYSLRGMLIAGETDSVITKLQDYSRRRLLGEHVPYAVEAYPEGNQRHLSAESALYCRVIIEGLFGLTPKGFKQFLCAPKIPAGWDQMSLRSIRAFGCVFDIVVKKIDGWIRLTVTNDNQVFEFKGEPSTVFKVDLNC
ncbi:hypothetical protein ACFQZT_25700 [Paenibacillus sp. GCM10027628]|uniref:hypothetical protein n=1 Tax=Paenibacillus sp. GCM10027628 TaxID=3273413 RepID=UPI003635B3A6